MSSNPEHTEGLPENQVRVMKILVVVWGLEGARATHS